jgi:predicted permease
MRAYRLLLGLYPKSFRLEYGGEMAADFATRRARAVGASLASLWLEALTDAVIGGLRAHTDILWQDLRLTARGLGRQPGFALTAVLVAGLGIGATTAAFSITDHVLVEALPFPESDRLVNLWQEQSYRGYSQLELSPANYRDWVRMETTLDRVGAWHGVSVNLSGEGTPEHLEGAAVTADLLPMLGSHPTLGRLFTVAEDTERASGTVILSTRLWHTHFGADPTILGRTLRLDGTPYVVIGIMPAEFTFPSRSALFWVPMQFAPGDFEDRTNVFLHGVGRLKPGLTIAQAQADFSRIAAELARAYPSENQRTGATVIALQDQVSARSRTLLLALAGASAAVLLIACSNLASLLLARALGRQRELAVRTALGAGRERIVRQMLTESAVLAIAGAVLGIGLAIAAVPILATLAPESLPIAELPALDGRLLALVTALTVLTALGVGVGPALRAGRSDVASLRDGARAGTSSRTERLRATLVMIQVAASVALLVVSALLLRALWRVEGRDPGFETTRVLSATTMLPMPKYEMTATRWAFYDRVLSAVRAQPGVEGAAYISFVPMSAQLRGGIFPVTLEGHPQDPTTAHVASVRFVTPGFFGTLGIPIRAGRDIADADTPASAWVAVVSESFAAQNWPGESALGRTFDLAFHARTVVGIVGNVAVRGLERTSEPQAYLPARQSADRTMTWFAPKDLVVRSAVDPAALAGAVRRIVHEADPDLPVSDLETLDALVHADNAPRQTQVRVLGGFALGRLSPRRARHPRAPGLQCLGPHPGDRIADGHRRGRRRCVAAGAWAERHPGRPRRAPRQRGRAPGWLRPPGRLGRRQSG